MEIDLINRDFAKVLGGILARAPKADQFIQIISTHYENKLKSVYANIEKILKGFKTKTI